MKKIYLFGNWKMNKNVAETQKFASEVSEILAADEGLKADTEFCVFPPYILIPEAVKDLLPIGVKVGAQNLNENKSGAFTGEVAPAMIKETGAEYVIIGHSERRNIYGESSELCNKKCLAAFANGLTPVLCVGETIDERRAGKTIDIVSDQLKKGITDFPADAEYVIAYEPVWAIGTGVSASAEDAEEVCAFIKTIADVPVLYGGSLKPSSAAELLSKPSIDGGLIGGASLKSDEYIAILKNYRDAEK